MINLILSILINLIPLILLSSNPSNGNVTKITDPRGGVTGLLYNELDQVYTLEKRPVTINGTLKTYRVDYFYDANNNVTKIEVDHIDETGIPYSSNGTITTEFGYDILNYVDTISREINESGNAVTKFMYDGNRNLTEILLGQANHLTEPQPANRVKRIYDGRDLLSIVTLAPEHADVSVTEYEYDGNKNISQVIRGSNDVGNEHVYDYLFDEFDRLKKIIDPMGNERVLSYDDSHNVTKMQVFGEWDDALGNSGNTLLREVEYVYDLANRLTNKSQAHFDSDSLDIGDGVSATTYNYNPASPFIVSVTNDRGHDISYTYDTVNRVETVTDAKGNSRTYAYDDNSNIETVTEIDQSDLSSNETFVTQLIYDELDRVTQLIDPINNVYNYQYDSRDNLITFTDALNVKTRNTYDGLNRLIQTIRALGSSADEVTIAQEWDHSSRLTSQTDGNGNVTTYKYDPLNRVEEIIYADGTLSLYEYDVHHNMDYSKDPNGSEEGYDYDKNDRLITKTINPEETSGVIGGNSSESFGYDGLGRLISAIDNDSIVRFEYDSLSNVLLEGLSFDGGTTERTTTASYDGLGNLKNITYPGERVLSYDYDELNRISVINENSNPLVTYNYIGSRIEKKTFLNGVNTNISYDGLGRIKHITHLDASSIELLAQAFNWDAMSNKTARSIDGVTESYSYDDLYRLDSSDYDVVGNREDTGYSVGAVGSSSKKMNRYAETPAGVTSHDVNGNLTGINANQKTLNYDYRNQMVLFNNGSDITTYKYDALGRRISKSNNLGETRYYSLGSRVIEETNSSNTTQASYVYGNYIDEVLSMNRSNNDYFYHSDDIYNVMALTNSMGGIAQEYVYNEFGKPTFTEDVVNPYMFNGREYDVESGFYNYRTRYLDPSVGRFTTRDTIGIWGDPSNIGNPYTYVGNNPQTFVDPYGENPEGLFVDYMQQSAMDPAFSKGVDNTIYGFFSDEAELVSGMPFMYEYATTDPFGFANTMKDAAVDSVYDILPDAYDKVTGIPGNVYNVVTTDDDTERGQSLREACEGASYLTVIYGIYKSFYNIGKKGAKESLKEILIDKNKCPETAKHIEDSLNAGYPDVLTVDRLNANQRRKESLSDIPKYPNMHRDEYPPAVFLEGGKGASVRPISPSDNMGAGASIGNQLRGVEDGSKVRIIIKE